jgi:hypothetical protein
MAHARPHDHAAAHRVGFSLLRLSAGERLVGACAVSALLWGVVFWATAI